MRIDCRRCFCCCQVFRTRRSPQTWSQILEKVGEKIRNEVVDSDSDGEGTHKSSDAEADLSVVAESRAPMALPDHVSGAGSASSSVRKKISGKKAVRDSQEVMSTFLSAVGAGNEGQPVATPIKGEPGKGSGRSGSPPAASPSQAASSSVGGIQSIHVEGILLGWPQGVQERFVRA